MTTPKKIIKKGKHNGPDRDKLSREDRHQNRKRKKSMKPPTMHISMDEIPVVPYEDISAIHRMSSYLKQQGKAECLREGVHQPVRRVMRRVLSSGHDWNLDYCICKRCAEYVTIRPPLEN